MWGREASSLISTLSWLKVTDRDLWPCKFEDNPIQTLSCAKTNLSDFNMGMVWCFEIVEAAGVIYNYG